MNNKIENKLEELKKDEIAVRIAVKEQLALVKLLDECKNKLVYKDNEITALESKLKLGYNALSKMLVEEKGA